MTEQVRQLKMTHQQISAIFDSLLKIPRTHKTLHPSQQRSKYSDILDWFTKVTTELLKTKDITPKQLSQKQQQIIVSCLQQLILLARKQCAQKSVLLQMILQYLVGTLKAYWKALENANRQVWYQFEHNSVRVEREYISELKRIQVENDELKKDKQHRWRNMFMLIKDNRIHRRQNKKLIVSINHQMDKNVSLAQQMILLRQQNQKLKLKLASFENDPIRIESYIQTQLKLMELQKNIRNYPKRSKKILKNDLLKIEIQQINNLNDRVKFIIKAIEQTGEIIDQFYDQETIFPNFQYNISTQTQLTTQDKGTNTPILRTANVETTLFAPDLAKFQIQQAFEINIKGHHKHDRKQTKQRQTRNGMMIPFNSSNRLIFRREDDKTKELAYKRLIDSPFSICQSVKMTIHKGRISYISTYNTQIFNGLEIIKKIQEQIQTQKKDIPPIIPKKEYAEIDIQTDPQQPKINRTHMKQPTKMSSTLPVLFNSFECFQNKKKKTFINTLHLRIYSQVNYQYNPVRNVVVYPKLKLPANPGINIQKEQIPKTNPSDKVVQSNKNLFRKYKRMNSLEKSYPPSLEDSLVSRKESQKKQANEQKKMIEKAKNDFSTQTEQKFARKNHVSSSRTSLQGKQQTTFITKQPNSINSSFLNSVDTVKGKNQNVKKIFNQTQNIISAKIKKTVQINSQATLFKDIQPKKLSKTSKISKDQLQKHKRASTDTNQNEKNIQNNKIHHKIKTKPLHRISEVLAEGGIDIIKEEFNPLKDRNALQFTMTKEGEIRSMDFSKGVQKILKNIDIRRNQIISNNYTLKSYLSSYFKCLYGKQIYQSFITFLAKSEPQQSMVCFSRLSNSKCPQAYLIDIFKAFVKAIGKCYLIGQSPCSSKLRYEVLKYLLNLFLQQEQINSFSLKMRSKGCFTLMGWFNSLEQELRKYSIQSQLYYVACRWFNQATDYLNYDFIEEIAYFMQGDSQTSKFLIKAKYLLSDYVPIHRLCLFSYRFKWNCMLNLETSINIEYSKRLGKFNSQDSICRIQQNYAILGQFKYLNKCFKQWSFLHQKYGIIIDPHLVMIIQLNILEYRLKNQMPLSKDLKYLSLIFEGLQKKKQLEYLKSKVQSGYVLDTKL